MSKQFRRGFHQDETAATTPGRVVPVRMDARIERLLEAGRRLREISYQAVTLGSHPRYAILQASFYAREQRVAEREADVNGCVEAISAITVIVRSPSDVANVCHEVEPWHSVIARHRLPALGKGGRIREFCWPEDHEHWAVIDSEITRIVEGSAEILEMCLVILLARVSLLGKDSVRCSVPHAAHARKK